jgi:shikimate kinase
MTGRASRDTDIEVLSFTEGKKPAEVITESGEAIFRKAESLAVKASGKMSRMIIATGGGVPTIPENYDALHQNGVVIWILKDINTLTSSGRPLSKGQNLHELYRRRKSAYSAFADLSVRSCQNPRTTAKMILSAFLRYIDEND